MMSLQHEFPLLSVTHKPQAPAGGTLHDFCSMGPYWWPDPSKADGLPYIRRDGHVNPEARGGVMDDAQRVKSLAESLRTLSERSPCTELIRAHVRALLCTFFLDAATRMNPSLTYGQSIPGVCNGRGIGIIDTVPFVDLLDSLARLEAHGEVLSKDEKSALQTWFSDYLDWLLTSPLGHDERNAKNNHGSWMDTQLCAYALFAGRPEIAHDVLREVPARRLNVQLAPDGSFPLELERTRPFGYTLYNLKALLRLVAFARPFGIDLYHAEAANGASLQRSVEALREVLQNPSLWTAPELDSKSGLPMPLPASDLDALSTLLTEWAPPDSK